MHKGKEGIQSWSDIPFDQRPFLLDQDQDVHWLAWVLDGLGLVHVKLVQHVIGVLGLTYERAILDLLDLKSMEELQLSHHGHLEPICHNPTKFLTESHISTTKYYVIDIYLANKDIIIDFASK